MKRHLVHMDGPLLVVTVALLVVGLGMIYSTTAADQPELFQRQLLSCAIGLLAMVLALSLDYHLLAKWSPLFYLVCLALLLVPRLSGHVVRATYGWIELGAIRLQPAEFSKIAAILLLAYALSNLERENVGLRELVIIALLLGLPTAAILLQADLGTAVTFIPLLLTVGYVGGLERRGQIALLLIFLLLVPVIWFGLFKDYHRERVSSIVTGHSDPLRSGYQTRQSLIAIGSGGLAGKGWFTGSQSQLKFVPEQHTDFIVSALAEEGGFVAILIFVALYAALLLRILRVAAAARDRLGRFLAIGVFAILLGQFVVNLGMVLDLTPVVGIPLPLISYGGSSLVATLASLGLVQNVQMRRFVNG
ncbi:MAG TPA: rod shape-determining protein RodA [Acidobacteriota bacterium]